MLRIGLGVVGSRCGITLPNFLIIGAAKAGTTSLYHYLGEHPEVYMCPVKETNYYWYEGQSEEQEAIRTRQAYERLFNGVTCQRAVGEASPKYLNAVNAPRRIAADLPEVKLIVSLRNPADRAYSSYLGKRRGGREYCRVEQAMQSGTYYFDTSLYYPRLRRYFQRFDRKRIKVILFDDLVADTGAVVRDLYEFLEVDAKFIANVAQRHNIGSIPRAPVLNAVLCRTLETVHRVLPASMRGTGLGAVIQRPLLGSAEPLPLSIRVRLLEQFRVDIAKTSELIGRDLSQWLRQPGAPDKSPHGTDSTAHGRQDPIR